MKKLSRLLFIIGATIFMCNILIVFSWMMSEGWLNGY